MTAGQDNVSEILIPACPGEFQQAVGIALASPFYDDGEEEERAVIRIVHLTRAPSLHPHPLRLAGGKFAVISCTR